MRAEDLAQILAAAGRAAWPDIDLDDAIFARRLERHLGSAPDRDAAHIRPDDFYLACACAEGDPAAIRAFERRFAGVIDRAVARFARGATVNPAGGLLCQAGNSFLCGDALNSGSARCCCFPP